jgi:hypothetical protein
VKVRLSDVVTFAVVGVCIAAAVAIAIVVVFAKHEIDHPPALVPPHVEGAVTASSQYGGFEIHADKCSYFNEKLLVAQQGDDDFLYIERDGAAVDVGLPGATQPAIVRFPRSDCSLYDVDLQRGDRLRLEIDGRSDETHFYWSGHAHVDCRRGALWVRANVTFDHCTRN